MSLEFASRHSFPASSLGTRIVRALAAIGRAIAHRRDVHRLLDLDERGLKDIGLVRSDVVGALEEAWDRDPSTVLLIRSVEQRARARAASAYAAGSPATTRGHVPGGRLPA